MNRAAIDELIPRLLIKAGELAIGMQNNPVCQTKKDGSIVTDADVAVSVFLRKELSLLQSDTHIIFDEEEIDKNNTRPSEFLKNREAYIWFIDPIAGTSCYAAGMPLYAISIGVLKDGKPIAGGVYFPGLREMYVSDGNRVYYTNMANQNKSNSVVVKMPQTEKTSNMPLFHHGNSGVLRKYNIVNRQVPFVIIPSVNIGLIWTAIGRFSASVIKVKLWDFAGAWAILDTLGFGLYNVDEGTKLSQISSDIISDDWELSSAYIVSDYKLFEKTRKLIVKTSSI